MKKVTRSVGGQRLKLVAGVRYWASRPWFERGRHEYPVTIQPMVGAPAGTESLVLNGLNLVQANRLVNAFNNGEMSFDGRVW